MTKGQQLLLKIKQQREKAKAEAPELKLTIPKKKKG